MWPGLIPVPRQDTPLALAILSSSAASSGDLSSRISHFFSRSDYVDSLLHDEFQLRESVLSERIVAEQNDVSSARFDEVLSSLDLNVRSVSSFSLDIIVH